MPYINDFKITSSWQETDWIRKDRLHLPIPQKNEKDRKIVSIYVEVIKKSGLMEFFRSLPFLLLASDFAAKWGFSKFVKCECSDKTIYLNINSLSKALKVKTDTIQTHRNNIDEFIKKIHIRESLSPELIPVQEKIVLPTPLISPLLSPDTLNSELPPDPNPSSPPCRPVQAKQSGIIREQPQDPNLEIPPSKPENDLDAEANQQKPERDQKSEKPNINTNRPKVDVTPPTAPVAPSAQPGVIELKQQFLKQHKEYKELPDPATSNPIGHNPMHIEASVLLRLAEKTLQENPGMDPPNMLQKMEKNVYEYQIQILEKHLIIKDLKPNENGCYIFIKDSGMGEISLHSTRCREIAEVIIKVMRSKDEEAACKLANGNKLYVKKRLDKCPDVVIIREEKGKGSFGKVNACFDFVNRRPLAAKIQLPGCNQATKEELLKERKHLDKIHSRYKNLQKQAQNGLLPKPIGIMQPVVDKVHCKCYDGDFTKTIEVMEGDFLEYYGKGDLTNWMDVLKSQEDTIECIRQLLFGMATLAACGFCHADIKPANCLVSNGRYDLADFGFATDTSKDGFTLPIGRTPLFSNQEDFVVIQDRINRGQWSRAREYMYKLDVYAMSITMNEIDMLLTSYLKEKSPKKLQEYTALKMGMADKKIASRLSADQACQEFNRLFPNL